MEVVSDDGMLLVRDWVYTYEHTKHIVQSAVLLPSAAYSQRYSYQAQHTVSGTLTKRSIQSAVLLITKRERSELSVVPLPTQYSISSDFQRSVSRALTYRSTQSAVILPSVALRKWCSYKCSAQSAVILPSVALSKWCSYKRSAQSVVLFRT